MTTSQNLTAIVALFFICGVYGDSDTCCYGAKCPLPIFVQYKGDDYDALYGDDENPGVVDKDVCCPDGHTNWLGSDKFEITYNGTIDTACLCGQDQSCNGDSGTLYGPMCTGESSVTSTSCPDAFVRHIDSSTGCVNLGTGCICTYSVSDSSTRAMTQRCLPETLCVNEGSGVYKTYAQSVLDDFKNGFGFYRSEDYYFKILMVDAPGDGLSKHDYPLWVIREINWTTTAAGLGFNYRKRFAYTNNDPNNPDGFVTEGFGDPSGFSWNNGVSITQDACPTPSPIATPRPTEEPTTSSPTTSNYNPGNSGGCRDIVIIGVYVLILCVVLRV